MVSRLTHHLSDLNVCQQLLLHLVKLIHILLSILFKTLSGISSTPKPATHVSYHISTVSGHHWVLELIGRHPDYILLVHCIVTVETIDFLILSYLIFRSNHFSYQL